jgi:DNA-binding beta-propeller fold protein YncE
MVSMLDRTHKMGVALLGLVLLAAMVDACGTASVRSRPARTAEGPHYMAWVTSTGTNQLIPVDLANGKVGTPIKVGRAPQGVALSPHGRFAFVADSGWGGNFAPSYDVTPVDLATRKALPPIKAGFGPLELATDPLLDRIYVVDMRALRNGNFFQMIDGTTVTPIDLRTMAPLAPI